jgi:hypothetical protein
VLKRTRQMRLRSCLSFGVGAAKAPINRTCFLAKN